MYLTMHVPVLKEVCEPFFSNTDLFVSSKKKLLELELPQHNQNVHIIYEQLLIVHFWYLDFPKKTFVILHFE